MRTEALFYSVEMHLGGPKKSSNLLCTNCPFCYFLHMLVKIAFVLANMINNWDYLEIASRFT